MHIKSFIILLFAALFIMSCSSCNTGKDEQNKNNSEKTSELKMKKVGNSKLPPGTVKISSLITSIKSDKSNIISLVTDKVLGYGQSTPVIGSGEIISIKLTAEQKEKLLSSSDNVNLVIKILPSGPGMEENNIWKLVSIEK